MSSFSTLTAYQRNRVNLPGQQVPENLRQIPNNAGGYGYSVDCWTQLRRFLVLGTEGGTYYVGQQKLTEANAQVILKCLYEDEKRTVDEIVAISHAGRAPKNDPALFALAMVFGYGNASTVRYAGEKLSQVARIGTHLLHLMAFINGLPILHGLPGSRGRQVRDAIIGWYTEQPTERAAYQVLKYQNRDGWTHRDVLRLTHPKPTSDNMQTLYHWIAKGWEGVGDIPHSNPAFQQLWAMERAKRADNVDTLVGLIKDYNLPREAIPTQYLTDLKVWDALFQRMPMAALIRSLATLTRIGYLAEGNQAAYTVTRRLASAEKLSQARVHPFQMLVAYYTYQAGKSLRGNNTWTPIQSISNALDTGFVASFKNVEPTGQRILVAMDVSGSMQGPDLMGTPGFTPAVGTAALAYFWARTEKTSQAMAFSTQFAKFNIGDNDTLATVIKNAQRIHMGGTDCALPMLYAMQNNLLVDAFVVLTDSETWAGAIQPMQALRAYREVSGIGAKLVVNGMTATDISIADPEDGGTLDVAGFDSAVPQIMSDFLGNRLFSAEGSGVVEEEFTAAE